MSSLQIAKQSNLLHARRHHAVPNAFRSIADKIGTIIYAVDSNSIKLKYLHPIIDVLDTSV